MDALLAALEPLGTLQDDYESAYAHWRMDREGVAWLQRNHYLMVSAAVLYLPIVFGLKWLMEAKDWKLRLRRPLVLWNLLLVIFNIYAFYYLAPGVISRVAEGTFMHYLCTFPPDFGQGPRSHALFLFALSKVPEMLDTVFIVLKRRPLILLHWYHHISVMLFCWNIVYSPSRGEGFEGAIFGAVNALVHCIMYTSYGLKAMGYKPPGDLAITTLQLTQMVGGSYLAVYRLLYCDLQRPVTAMAGVAMYASYFVLFAHFFYKRYLAPKAAKAPAAKKAQ